MTPHNLLRQLHGLDRPSHEFHDRLSNVLYGGEYKQSVSDLGTDEVVWLLDYLDKVRRPISSPLSAYPSVGSRHSRSR